MHNRRIRAVVVSCLIGTIALGALAAAIVFRDIVAAFLHTGSADLALAMLKLESPIASTRATGAKTIAKHGPAAHHAIPRLIDALDDDKIAHQVQTALVRIGPTVVPPLTEHLNDPRTLNLKPAANVLVNLGSTGMPPLVDLMKHESPERRKAAAQALSSRRLSVSLAPAIPQLLQLLEDSDADVREAALSALRRDPLQCRPFVPLLVEKMQRRETSVRITAMELLKKQNSGALTALPELERGLTDNDAIVRIAALEAWVGVARNTSVAIDPILSLLDDPEPSVRRAAVMYTSFWHSHEEQIARAFLKVLRDEEIGVRREATLRSVNRMSPHDPVTSAILVPALIANLQDPEAEVRKLAAVGLGRASENERAAAVAALLVALNDENSEVRASVGGALGELDPSTAGAAVPVLAKLLNEPGHELRYSARIGLTAFGPRAEPAIPELVRMGETYAFSSPHAWGELMETLRSIGEPALSTILGYVQHPQPAARKAAIVVLSVTPKLPADFPLEIVRRLQDVDADVRLAAADALAHRGMHIEDVSKALETASKQDVDPRVRMRAVWALAVIEDKLHKERATVKNENSGR